MDKNKQHILIDFLDSITQKDFEYTYEKSLADVLIYVYSVRDFHTILEWCGSWGAYFSFSEVEHPDERHQIEYQIDITDYDKDLSKYI
jgi:hypothetical protein